MIIINWLKQKPTATYIFYLWNKDVFRNEFLLDFCSRSSACICPYFTVSTFRYKNCSNYIENAHGIRGQLGVYDMYNSLSRANENDPAGSERSYAIMPKMAIL